LSVPTEGADALLKTPPPQAATGAASQKGTPPSRKASSDRLDAYVAAGRVDAKLVRAARAGDEAAFEKLIDRYKPLVRVVIAKVLKGHDAIDDLVQDVFLKAYVNLGTLDDPTRFRAWLLQIGTNRARDYVRHISRRERTVEDSTLKRAIDSGVVSGISPSASQSSESKAASSRAEQNELRLRIVKAIHELPAGYHKLASMRYLDGASYAEIAKTLRLPEKTILRRARRARAMLRRSLKKDRPNGA
jgi:RNA polymerase sigma-70 factor (ECF subfamily)